METYIVPRVAARPAPEPKTAYLIASGDLRHAANRSGWGAQQELEAALTAAFERYGWKLKRAHAENPDVGHGFISSQVAGLEVFKGIPETAPLVVAEAVWQYSHHVLAGLRDHQGPILTAANFSGTAPGLVGMLNLNGGLTKMAKPYSTIWSIDRRLGSWVH